MENKIVAVVGMCGSGKSVITEMLIQDGFQKVYFGDVTFDEMKRRGLELNWENEKLIREEFRATGDMGIYAKLNAPKIEELYKQGNVVVESLYSWSEYKYLKEIYKDNFILLSLVSNAGVREERLAVRDYRSMTKQDVYIRDYSEIENLEKGGPIARADYYLLNNGTMEELKAQYDEFMKKFNLK